MPKNKDLVHIYRNNDELVDLGDNLFKKQILRVGDWLYGDGKFEVTTDYLKKVAENFKKGVIENVFVPLTHSDDPRDNTGDVKEVEVSKDGKALEAVLSVDDSAAKLIKDKKVKGVSCSIEENYMDKEKKITVGSVLRHVALVMEPYIKGLAPFEQLADKSKQYIVLSDESKPIDSDEKKKLNIKKEKKHMKIKKSEKLMKEIETVKTQLSDNAKILSEKDILLAEKDAELKKLADEKLVAEKAKKEVEVIAMADKFISEGKMVPAQKDSFVKLSCEVGSNEIVLSDTEKKTVTELLSDFVEKNAKIKLEEGGGQAPEGDNKDEVTEETKTELSKFGVSEEDYKKYGKADMTAADIANLLQK